MDAEPESKRPAFPLDFLADRRDQFLRTYEDLLCRILPAKENRHDRVTDELVDIAAGRNDCVSLQSEQPVQLTHEETKLRASRTNW